jgi:hypothetical protein
MINIDTVLILGAGASKPFGFPTGRELVEKVCEFFGDQAHPRFDVFKNIAIKHNPYTIIKEFPNALRKADPASIDIWLEHNNDPDIIWAGKVAMAMVLLNHEHRSDLRPNNNWYQLLFDRLDAPFDKFQDNKLTIVTFNYDRSLEQYLFERFKHTHYANIKKNNEQLKEKLKQLKILHVYGSLGYLSWQIGDSENLISEVPYGARNEENVIWSAAKNIEIMSENNPVVSDRLQEFKVLMQNCQALYFLGFGYHEVNMKRLGIDILSRPNKIMGTAYGLSYQRMKEIERLNIKREFRFPEGLFRKTIYDFFHDCVDFNERGYPPQWAYRE